MTSVNFQQWIQHPEMLNRDTLYELRNLLARYPYFQSLRLLLLKNMVKRLLTILLFYTVVVVSLLMLKNCSLTRMLTVD